MGNIKLKILTGIFLMAFLNADAFPRWYVNGSSNAFYEPASISGASSLEDYVIEGAGYFLDSYAHILLLMKNLEWADKNGAVNVVDNERSFLLDKALTSMERANNVFTELKRLADGIPYNTAVTDRLRQFDYGAFQAANGIDDGSFRKVRNRLVRADIRAIYGDLITDTGTIIKMLKQVKGQVDAGVFPSTWDVWKLDRAYSDSERFGQYTARIFEAAGLAD